MRGCLAFLLAVMYWCITGGISFCSLSAQCGSLSQLSLAPSCCAGMSRYSWTKDFARSGSLATDTVVLPKGESFVNRFHVNALLTAGTDALASLPHSIEVSSRATGDSDSASS